MFFQKYSSGVIIQGLWTFIRSMAIYYPQLFGWKHFNILNHLLKIIFHIELKRSLLLHFSSKKKSAYTCYCLLIAYIPNKKFKQRSLDKEIGADDINDNGEFFYGKIDRQKTLSLFSRRDHCQRFALSQASERHVQDLNLALLNEVMQ